MEIGYEAPDSNKIMIGWNGDDDQKFRQLTYKETMMPITYDRISHFHGVVGEDLIDQHDHVNDKVLGGFLLGRTPERAEKILKEINSSWGPSWEDIYDDEGTGDGYEEFYTLFAEFLNLTVATRARYNTVLILTNELYNELYEESND